METLLKVLSQSCSEGNEDKGRETNTEKREKDDQLQSNLSEMKEENERLKMMISRIMNDSQLLQTRISKIASSEQSKMDTKNFASHINHQEPHEFVTLSLGSTYVESRKEKLKSLKSKEDVSTVDESLTLGLDEFVNAKMQYVSSSSHEETKSHENKETWPPSKVASLRNEDDESNALLSDSAKRARVSVRARCDAPTMNDGCQWRKYGQKVSKGNPRPRAYYRCTVAPNCPVRKQVQRCKDDVSVLITTYDGTHNHVLPVSATAMASTTAAAASMLSSGSVVSRQNAAFSFASEVASTSSSIQSMGQNRFYLQNQLMSPSSLHPTVTLDLTTPRQSTYNKNSTYPWNLSYWQRHAITPLNSSSLNISNDIIAKAIASDPNFQSVLHTAISSYVTTGSNNGVQETSTSQKLTNSFTFDQGNEHQ